jgi:hypothetical protein
MNATIQFTCPHCQKQMKLPSSTVGKQGKCPSCSAVITVTASQLGGNANEIQVASKQPVADPTSPQPVQRVQQQAPAAVASPTPQPTAAPRKSRWKLLCVTHLLVVALTIGLMPYWKPHLEPLFPADYLAQNSTGTATPEPELAVADIEGSPEELPEEDFEDLAGPDTEIAEIILDISPADQRETIAAFEEKWGRIGLIEHDPAGNVVQLGTTLYQIAATDAVLVDLKRLTSLKWLSIKSGRQGGSITDAGLRHLQGLTNLTALGFPHEKITDAGLVHLKGLTKLERFSLSRSQITGTGLEHLKGLSRLMELNLSRTQVSDAGLEHLKGLSSLMELHLSRTQISDAGLVHLKGLTSLMVLDLGSCGLDGAGLKHLKELPNLVVIFLIHNPISDASLVHLNGITSLKNVSLNDTQVTDAGLEHLKGLSSLEELDLGRTQISDAGLVHLKGLTSLEYLSLFRAQVSDAGVAELQKALPDCEISH